MDVDRQVEVDRGHDRDKERLLAEDDPVFKALGLTDAEGRMKPSRHAKYRQVEEFLRLLDTSISDAVEKRHLRRPTPEEPLRIADLGCGNAYLTFAAQRFLANVVIRGRGCSRSDLVGAAGVDGRGRPRVGSVLIDGANRYFAPQMDASGRRRGKAPDIGALEYRPAK